MGQHILKWIQAFHKEANACVRMKGEFSESFTVEVGVRQRCVMSPWLFNIFIDGCKREMKDIARNRGAKLRLNRKDWSVVICLLSDGSVAGKKQG